MRNTKVTSLMLLFLILMCMFPVPSSATTVELDEGNVTVSTTISDYITVNCTQLTGDDHRWYMKFDYELRNTSYSEYIVQTALIQNKTDFSDIPSVVVQPLAIRNADLSGDFGNITVKVYKLAEAPDWGQEYVFATIVFNLDVNETWLRSIGSDQTKYLYDRADTGPTYDGFNNLGEYYGHYTAGRYYFKCGEDSDHTTASFANAHGIAISPKTYVFGSNPNSNTTVITSQREFYNEYAITEEDTLDYRRINVTRAGGDFTNKLTNSSVYIVNEDYELELETDFTQDSNTSHVFDNVPVAIWIGAKGMESDATDRYVQIYNDLGVDTFAEVKGYTYDAETGLVLSGVSVESGTFSDTSEGTGYYHIGPVVAEQEYTITASKSGYASYTFSVYLPRQANYSIDIPLVPDSPTYTGTAILGIVNALPYHQPYENATVYVSNATWDTTVTTNNVGYYVVDELTNDTSYWINVTEPGYRYNNTSVAVVNDTHVQHNVNLDPALAVDVRARDLDTSAIITSFTATMNDTTTNTSDGLVTFTDLSYGVHELTVSSDMYYPYQIQIYVDSNVSHVAYLQISGEGVNYPQHFVALKVVNWYGRAIPGVNVNVTGGNVTMSNFTGSDGVAGFLMSQNVYYNITLTSGSNTKTISLMPVYTEYTIFFVFTEQVPPQDTQNWYDYINFTVASENINSTHAYINLTFSDNSTGSSNLYMFVNDSDDTNLANTSSATLSVVVNQTQGASFYVGFTCDYTGYDQVSVKRVVVFDWDMGSDSALTSYTRELLAIAFLIILGAVFGVLTVPYGGLILPIFALILNWIGWFTIVDSTTTRMVCITALVLGIMYYMRARDSEVI